MMLKKLISILIITAAILAPVDSFADKKLVTITQPKHLASFKIEKDVGIIQIIGEINDDSDQTVHRAFVHFKKENIKTVIIHLNSLGGKLDSGTFIVNDILDAEQNKIEVITEVDHKDMCASMCTGIFAVGSARMSAPDTIWIFHSPFVNLTDEEKKDPKIIELVNKTLKEAQDYMMNLYSLADPKWTESVLKNHVTQPGNDLVITGQDIIAQHNNWIQISIDD